MNRTVGICIILFSAVTALGAITLSFYMANSRHHWICFEGTRTELVLHRRGPHSTGRYYCRKVEG